MIMRITEASARSRCFQRGYASTESFQAKPEIHGEDMPCTYKVMEQASPLPATHEEKMMGMKKHHMELVRS